jgi:putative transposase
MLGGMRKLPLVTGEYYHIYNRGVDRRSITEDKLDSDRFLKSLVEFNRTEPVGSLYELSFAGAGPIKASTRNKSASLVDVIAYCLNPNHFHLLLRQRSREGISKFVSKLCGGYAYYYNNRHKRQGALFQGRFKAKHVEGNAHLLHLSAYINLNDKVHQLGVPSSKLVRNSWLEYENTARGLCDKGIVLGQFKTSSQYVKYAEDALIGMLEKRPDYKELQELTLE